MKLKLIATCFILLFTSLSYSQITLKGTVKDSLQNPLTFANIIATPKDSTLQIRFAISDEYGRYQLQLQKEKTYVVNVSYIGFESKKETLKLAKSTVKNFTLIEGQNQLEEVIIELPVTVKQDTIIYDTKKFVTGKERKLKNVLKKLPGVEVDRDGNVLVLGKKVTKLLVDNKKFFGGNTKLGVNNIPADAVDKIEILDNYNEVAFLKNISDSDEMAMNVRLKEDKKRFVFGDIETGKGNKDFYRTHTNLFYYSPKTNVNFIGNVNNTGEKTFTFRDYLNFNGGVNAIFNGNFNFKQNNFSDFRINQDVLKSSQQFAALNISKATSNTLNVSGYVIYNKNKNQRLIETLNNYTSFIEDKESKTATNNNLGIGKLIFEYKPKVNEQWYVKTLFKRTRSNNNNAILSQVNNNINNIDSDRNINATYFNNNIEWHKEQSEKHTFSSVIDYTYDKNNSLAFWKGSKSFLTSLHTVIPPLDINQNLFQLNQEKGREQNYLHTVFKDFWLLNNTNHIYFTLGNSFNQEQYQTLDVQLLDNGAKNNFLNHGFNNDVNFKLNDFFLGTHYKFNSGIFTLKQGLYLHNYSWKELKQSIFQKSKWVVLPDFLMKIEFNKSKKIELKYNLQTNFSEASQLANRFYLQSYNSVFKGNSNLENELFHKASIYYKRFNLYRGFSLYANVNYTKKIKGYKNAVEFHGINRYLTTVLLDNPNENIGFRGTLKKRIKKIKYNVRTNYNYTTNLQSINNSFVKNNNINYSYQLGAETLFDDFPTIEIGYKRQINKYNSSGLVSKFITVEPFINIDYDFLDGFIFSFDYKYFNYKSETQNNSYQMSNLSLLYKHDNSAWSYKVSVNNLFDTTFKLNNSFSDYLISDTKTYILPRVIMFTLGYNL